MCQAKGWLDKRLIGRFEPRFHAQRRAWGGNRSCNFLRDCKSRTTKRLNRFVKIPKDIALSISSGSSRSGKYSEIVYLGMITLVSFLSRDNVQLSSTRAKYKFNWMLLISSTAHSELKVFKEPSLGPIIGYISLRRITSIVFYDISACDEVSSAIISTYLQLISV